MLPAPVKPRPGCEKPRHSCPFYGFHCFLQGKSFVDSQGNQCALIINSHSPCQMKRSGLSPDWAECFFNNNQGQNLLINLRRDFSIFPDEFRPPNVNSWLGISFDLWMDYVLSDECPRPDKHSKPKET